LIFKSVVELPLVLGVLAVALVFMGTRERRHPVNKWDFILPASLGLLVGIGSVWLSSIPFTASPMKIFLVFIAPIFLCLSFADRPLRFALGFAALLLASGLLRHGQVLLTERSFFGVYRVSEQGGYRQLAHGSTVHGMQSLDPKRSREPLSYYYATGPIGQALTTSSIRERVREVAVIGLGAGSLACYAESERHFIFYEIDPTVEAIARNPGYFTFLRDCSKDTEVVLGDARLSLRAAPPHKYDMVIADAFSSDSVPVHLVTREAIELYLAKLAAHGILAFNISNRYLDLRPVLAAIARDAGLACIVRDDSHLTEYEQSQGKLASIWLLMARNRIDLASLASDPSWETVQVPRGSRVWTDDYSTIAGIIHWN
jgi:spermidine synthase